MPLSPGRARLFPTLAINAAVLLFAVLDAFTAQGSYAFGGIDR
jgi:hypothetical protein